MEANHHDQEDKEHHLQVSNLKKATSLYENALGRNKTAESPDYVTFDVGGVLPGLGPSGKKGRKEDAPDIYLTVDDVDIEYNGLEEKGVKFATEPRDQSWGGRTAAFLHPDENMFILVSPNEKQD